MKQNIFSLHGKSIVDLIKETQQQPAAQPATPAPAAHWVQGNHNIVVSGGSVSIHLGASACPLYKEGAHD